MSRIVSVLFPESIRFLIDVHSQTECGGIVIASMRIYPIRGLLLDSSDYFPLSRSASRGGFKS